MSGGDDETEPSGDPQETLAGEYALGLLTPAEALSARGLIAGDAGFARAVAAWEVRFAPLFDAIAPATPPDRVWAAIEMAIRTMPRDGEIVRLRRQVRQWRFGTGLAAALAGVLAIFGLRPDHAPVAPPRVVAPPPPLAAALAPKGGGSISVIFRPGDQRLSALAGDLTPRTGHDLELWVLPAGGAPLPLGLVSAGRSRHLALPPAIAARLEAGSTIAVSLEPIGGSPTGLPTGPVLAVAKILPA